MWDISSLTRNQTHAPCIGNVVLTIGPPGKTEHFLIPLKMWCVLVTQSCPTLCNPMDCNLPGSSVHEILQARILEWIANSFYRGSSWPRDQTWVSCMQADALPSELIGKHKVKVTQLCLTLCDPMNCSPPGSSIHGILQAGILEWDAIAFSRECLP